MAGRIKGITIEIGGDTTKLDQALKSVNGTIKATQTQLRDVGRLLKLDPSNTELLSQKQRSLKEAIGATKEKLETLKTAQEQAKQQLESGDLGQEKYDALQREIISTEEELKRLAQEAANANTVLNGIETAGRTMENVGGKMASVGGSLAKNVTAPIAAVGAAAVKTTADFDEQMSKVSAISGASGKDFDDLRDKAREMGAKTKFSATEAGQGFEYMAMAGWKSGEMLDGIEGIMNLAAASGEDLGRTSDIVTDALTAFGLKAKDSAHFADVLAAASSNSNTNVSMLGESFKYAAPVAGALGYSAEDTAVALGLMANAGIKASQGGTALRNILTNMSKPTKDSSAAMERLGISLSDDEGRMYSFREIMDQLREGFGHINMPAEEFNRRVSQLDADLEAGNITQKKYDKALEELTMQAYGAEGAEKARAAAMLAGKNGMSGLLAIVNASEEDYEKLTGAVADSSKEFEHAGKTYKGTAEYMAAIMQDNLAGQVTVLKSAVQELAIQIGDALMPTVRNIVSKIQAFVEKLQKMDDGTRRTILRIAAFAAAIGPALLMVGKLASGIGKGLQAFSSLGKGILTFMNQAKLGVGAGGKLAAAIGGISAPVAAVIAGVAALVAAFVHLWRNNEEFRNKVTAIWNGVREKLSGAMKKITDAVNRLGFNFKDITGVMKSAWDGFCNGLAPVLEGVVKAAGEILEGIIDVVSGIIGTVTGLIIGFKDGDWSVFTQGLLDIINGVVNAIWGVVQGFFRMFGIELSDFDGDWGKVWEGMKSVFQKIWNAISGFFSGIWEKLKSTVLTVTGAIGSAVSSAWGSVKAVFDKAWKAISSFFRGIWEGMNAKVRDVLEGIKSAVSNGWGAVKAATESILKAIKKFLSTTWESIRNMVGGVLDGIGEKVGTAWTNIKATVSGLMEKIKSGISEKWEAAKTAVLTTVENIKAGISEKWAAVKTSVSSVMETIKGKIEKAWNAAKTAVSDALDGIKTKVSTVWEAVKEKVSGVVNSVKTTVTNGFNAAKGSVERIFEGIKGTASTVWNGIRTTVTSVVNRIQTSVSTAFTGIRSTASQVWQNIKEAMTSPIRSAKTAISTVLSSIKNLFNFSWSLPKIKLPHFTWDWSDLGFIKIPHISVEWYRKAMGGGMILDSPTIFGAAGGKLLGAGEAGSETVVGTKSLMDMIRRAVESVSQAMTVNYGGVTINVYSQPGQDISALADEIEDRINSNVMRRRAAFT